MNELIMILAAAILVVSIAGAGYMVAERKFARHLERIEASYNEALSKPCPPCEASPSEPPSSFCPPGIQPGEIATPLIPPGRHVALVRTWRGRVLN